MQRNDLILCLDSRRHAVHDCLGDVILFALQNDPLSGRNKTESPRCVRIWPLKIERDGESMAPEIAPTLTWDSGLSRPNA